MMLKKKISCLFICFVFALSTHAQDKDKAILLKSLFEILEKKHNVNFNFIEEEIAIFKVIPPNSKLSLKDKLNYITTKTDLKFKFVTTKYISVINDKKLDKPMCGFLLDEETNLPIESATIHAKDTPYSVKTNEKGYFEFKLKSINNIEISHVNYEKITIPSKELYTENCPTIMLKPLQNQLDEVVALIYLTKGITKRKNGTFVIKPKEFGLLPGLTEPDVYETLKQIPGVTSTDGTISNISVRGGTHDQNLFLWNGIRLFQTGHFFGLISALNPNLAHTITISKNGSSPFYGESVSSVVDISTHTKLIEENSMSIGANLINLDAYAKFKTSKTSNLEISARRSYTDMLNTPTYKNYYNRVFQNTVVTDLTNNQEINYNNDLKFYFYDITTQFHKKFGKKSDLYIDGITISNILNLNEFKIEDGINATKNSNLKQQTIAGNLLLKTDWNEKNKTEINSYVSYYSIISQNEAIESNQIFNQENDVLDIGIRIKNSHVLNSKFKLFEGYQFNEIGIRNYDRVNTPLFSRNIKNVLRSHALVGELQYTSKNNNVKTNVGFRQNYIEEFGKFIFEPRFQFTYAINMSLQLELLGEIKNQTSSQIIDLQQDFLGIEKRRWVLSNNDDVPIIKNKQISLGLTFNKKNWLITWDNFYKQVNGITSKSQGFQNQLELTKVDGDYATYGSELLIQKQFKKITAWISYTHTENHYSFNTLNVTDFSNNYEIKHNIGSALIYDFRGFKTALGARWFTGKPTTQPSNAIPVFNANGVQGINYNEPNSSNLSDYTEVNLSSSYTFKWGKSSTLALGISVQNLLNSDNIINQYYRINQNTNNIEQVNTHSLERTPNAFIRFNY